MKKIWVGLWILCFSLSLLAQTKPEPGTNVDHLLLLSEKYSKDYKAKHETALRVAQEKGWPIRKKLPYGGLMELQYLGNNGIPVYYTTYNINAARAAKTDQLWPGGQLGLNLTGGGMIVGEWDAEGVLLSHLEFGGRVTQIDNPGIANDHATHVAGTMVAAGVDINARGMAYQANLHAYDWDNDLSEMAAAAAAGLLLSNHSYGYSAGWYFDGFDVYWYGDITISQTEDYQFGYYDSTARQCDQIAFDAPSYLIVNAVGNDRDDAYPQGTSHYVWDPVKNQWVLSTASRNPDGPYDCIPFFGVAKNILTVGAVDDDGQTMTTFSSWGPADDGRIKPDICGNGKSLYSTVSNGGYDVYSGTSMASPNVCGSLVLIQQHHFNLFGSYLGAALLKGLAIHTASDLGQAGPDYQYGWGMFNSARAAQLIASSNSLFVQRTLVQGTPITFEVSADGTAPLIVTICWIDPPGTPVAPAVDPPDKMLVNDLDLRVISSSSGQTYLPWILDPLNPSNPAITGDNNTDNVEQVHIQAAPAGMYTIAVAHKGTLVGGSQNFAIIFDNTQPITPSINAPSNLIAQAYKATIRLSWQDNSNDEDGFEIQRNTGQTRDFETIALVIANTTSYTNTVTTNTSYTYRVRAYNGSSFSDFSNTATAKSGGDKDTRCGATGVEFLLFLAFLILCRRFRRTDA